MTDFNRRLQVFFLGVVACALSLTHTVSAFGGDCCEANGTPGCSDDECESIVCAIDPFCCDLKWDSICAGEAADLCEICFQCGSAQSGNCCEAGRTPFCENVECCEQVCATDPFCCESTWDVECAKAAHMICDACAEPACGIPDTGSCCDANMTPFCEDAECCQMVCAVDPLCCETSWDEQCADAAADLCTQCLQCGDAGSGNCCTDTGSPFCEDAECCETVCAIFPFCCEVTWDGFCANEAVDLCDTCFQCGSAKAGGCCQANGSPSCEDPECCKLVCAMDAFCCDIAWDGTCAETANTFCAECGAPACGVAGTGDCCAANGTPFCEAAFCCEKICAIEPFCCDVQWDGGCADLAQSECVACGADPGCGDDGTGDCCVANGSPFCDDAECCQTVCAIDPFCCEFMWDSICADEAQIKCIFECSAKSGCGESGAGDCCEPNGTPGCENVSCCESVCANDPFCCETAWDGTCVSQALADPACDCVDVCPWDLDDSESVDVSDLLELLGQWGGPGSADFDMSGAVGVADLLKLLSTWGKCPL